MELLNESLNQGCICTCNNEIIHTHKNVNNIISRFLHKEEHVIVIYAKALSGKVGIEFGEPGS